MFSNRFDKYCCHWSVCSRLFVLGTCLVWSASAYGPAPDLDVRLQEVQCLASAVWHEARGESLKGQRAVAEVVWNRAVKSGKSFCEVVAQKRQFSWMNKKGLMPLTSDVEAIYISAIAHRQVLKDESYMFFYSGRKPVWAKRMDCVKLSGHNFCKLKERK